MTITGTATQSTANIEKTTTFTITLVDPCNPPASVVASSVADQEYTITDTSRDYKVADFIVTPSFCQVDYTVTIDPICDGENCGVDQCANQSDSENDPLNIELYCNSSLNPAG